MDLTLDVVRIHVLPLVDRDAARGRALLAGLLDVALTEGHWGNAAVLAADIATDLTDRRCGEDDLDRALEMIAQQHKYTASAGFGPWTRLLGAVQRLRVRVAQDRHDEVLDEVDRLRGEMAELPAEADRRIERVTSWSVREAVLDLGLRAARQLSQPDRVGELETEREALVAARRPAPSPPSEVAGAGTAGKIVVPSEAQPRPPSVPSG